MIVKAYVDKPNISFKVIMPSAEVSFKGVERDKVKLGVYRDPVNIFFNGDPALEQRVSEIEESTDGLIDGVDFLTLYRLRRDN